ncbi:MAG: hypothetical protein JW806_10545 [Sedimentisphaerales bacterium]|nr:hypothetical protein [Sedimentisphaerales bacterium]
MQENTDSYSQQNVNENIQPQQSQPQPQVVIQQKNTGARCLIGCGIGCLILIILMVLVTGIGGYFGYKYVMGKVNAWTQEFENMGFEKVKGQIIEVAEDVNAPKLYLGQTVKIMGNCEKDVAIISQIAEIHSNVKGTVYFRGQSIIIQPGAVIEGDLDIVAQTVEVYGQVKGDIKGEYQVMEDKRKDSI